MSDLLQRADYWGWMFRGEGRLAFYEQLPPERENVVRTALRLHTARVKANAVFLRKSVAGSGPWTDYSLPWLSDQYPPWDGEFGNTTTLSGKDMMRGADLVIKVQDGYLAVVKDRSGEFIPLHRQEPESLRQLGES